VSHQTIVVVDVASFTSPDRTNLHQRAVREGLLKVLRDAFSEVGIRLGDCTVEDRGDGKMILMPPGIDNGLLGDQLPGRLVAGLRRYNAVSSDEAKIQLRAAFHSGEVYQDGQGVVGTAVNLAFRLVEAPEAKLMLKELPCVLALIASDDFYHDVIVHDPAADPYSYQTIRVAVHDSSAVAWLRIPERVMPVDETSRVLDLLPAEELRRIQERLLMITIPQLRTLVHRAAGPGIPPAGGFANAWEAFSYLEEFNAGGDGFPPALMFVELVACQVAGNVSAHLKRWNDDQARRLRLEAQLHARREAIVPIPDHSLLYLMIVVELDGIDPVLYRVSHWRQDDATVWPPARGETHVVTFDDLEQCVDNLVVNAEKAWSGHAGPVAVEFVLPRALLDLPVHHWHKEHDSGDPRPLCLDYPIVVRSLERMQSPHWHRVWHQRWQILINDPLTARVHFAQPADTGEPHRIDAILSDPRLVLMVLTVAPPRQPRTGADELTAALRSGLPALLWHPEVSPEVLREVVTQLIDDDGLGDLPGRARASRQAAFEVSASFYLDIIRDLVVLWDDPHRLVFLNQPSDQPLADGDIADDHG
jgi:class 3 adenylate cyclase